nr:MAG TPA: hypothetical protein [Caudoviricetes sp.]
MLIFLLILLVKIVTEIVKSYATIVASKDITVFIHLEDYQ